MTPFNLAPVEFDSVESFLLSRLEGVKEEVFAGTKAKVEFRQPQRCLTPDVHLVPSDARASAQAWSGPSGRWNLLNLRQDGRGTIHVDRRSTPSWAVPG